MSSENIVNSLTHKLLKTSLPKEEGVSFAGKALKLNTVEDAQEVVDKINDCPGMEYLNLEGNTLGVEAAEVIAKALETKSKMKKAFWKDMFTGRMKDEIPIALKHLSRGLMKANAQLEILDLSDNASGPIGVKGIVELLKSPTCYTLKELKLNNMGLGITGAKMLAAALKDCYESSKAAGTPLGLKVFIAGRNRLENEGTAALAKVFEEMGTLEQIHMPQNGIYLPGIEALSKAFSKNENLREINLNDNTLNPEGSSAISKSLSNLKNLVKLDLGDCLMKNQGVLYLAEALEHGHSNLEEVIVSFNSIKIDGGIKLVDALLKKDKLKKLVIGGNKFGEGGIEEIRQIALESGKEDAFGSFSEDEGSESDDSDDDKNGDVEECEEDYSEGDSEEEDQEEEHYDEDQREDYVNDVSSEDENFYNRNIQSGYSSYSKMGTAKEFLQNPSVNNFNRLGDEAVPSLIQEIKGKPYDTHLDELIKVIMNISSLIEPNDNYEDTLLLASKELYDVLFKWAEERGNLSYVNNTLPVYLGLIKDEETKKPLKNNKIINCIFTVNQMINQQVFPKYTKDIIVMLMKSRM